MAGSVCEIREKILLPISYWLCDYVNYLSVVCDIRAAIFRKLYDYVSALSLLLDLEDIQLLFLAILFLWSVT